MTDRHSGYVVVLEKDVREDDSQQIIDAIQMVKGVLRVEPVTADPIAEGIWRTRAHVELMERVFAAVRSVTFPDWGSR